MNSSDVVDWINRETSITAFSTKNIYREVEGAYVRWMSGNREYITPEITRTRDRFEILLNSDDSDNIDTLIDALLDINNVVTVTEDFEDALGASWTKENSDRNGDESYTGDWSYLLTGTGGSDSNLIYALPVTDAVLDVSFYAKWKTDIDIVRFFAQSLAGAGFYIDTDANVKWYNGSGNTDLGVDMAEDTWYKFELQNIDIRALTMDVLIDDDVKLTDADWSSSGLSELNSFKWNADVHAGTQNVWIDDITITYEHDVFFKPEIIVDELGISPTGNYNWRVLMYVTDYE